MKEKIINTLKGVAIGDAFGLGIEFKSRFWIKDNVHFDKFITRDKILPGTYSDDTEHTIGIVKALLSDEPFSLGLLLSKFKEEYDNDKKRKGYPREGHGSIKDWYEGKKSMIEIHGEQARRYDPGNAPVMRAVPIAFTEFEKLVKYSTINAYSTHPNPVGRDASILTVFTAWYFLREEGSPSQLIPFLKKQFRFSKLMCRKLSMIDELPEPDKLSEKNYLFLHGEQPLPYIKWDKNVYGLPCAAMKTALNVVYVMKHSSSAFEALQHSINMGGDVDSLAAVCTGIAGGRYGLDSLPQFMLNQTEGLDRMEILGDRLYEKFIL